MAPAGVVADPEREVEAVVTDMLDGFRVGGLPAGIGDQVSDFASEWEDVRFTTRVWERQVDGGHRVDLRVHVLRGARLDTLAALRDFLAGYHERDPAHWPLAEFTPGSAAGLIGGSEAFWLVEPGVGIDVLVDAERYDQAVLRGVAEAIERP